MRRLETLECADANLALLNFTFVTRPTEHFQVRLCCVRLLPSHRSFDSKL